jgi:hypothetical protein
MVLRLAEPLIAPLPDHSLTILDRGFLSYALLHRLASAGPQRHWLIRAKSHEHDVAPTRISFRHTLMLVRGFWQLTAWIASPGKLPRRLEDLHQETALLILPPRRERRYPRAVKIKMSSYPRSR